jgi:hypothetical protein
MIISSTARTIAEIAWLMSTAASATAVASIHRSRRLTATRSIPPSASTVGTAPNWCDTKPMSNVPGIPTPPNGLETQSDSTTASPAALRPSPIDRARNATASGSPRNELITTTLNAVATDTSPIDSQCTTPTAHDSPGPRNRYCSYPTPNRCCNPSSRPRGTNHRTPNSARTRCAMVSSPGNGPLAHNPCVSHPATTTPVTAAPMPTLAEAGEYRRTRANLARHEGRWSSSGFLACPAARSPPSGGPDSGSRSGATDGMAMRAPAPPRRSRQLPRRGHDQRPGQGSGHHGQPARPRATLRYPKGQIRPKARLPARRQ